MGLIRAFLNWFALGVLLLVGLYFGIGRLLPSSEDVKARRAELASLCYRGTSINMGTEPNPKTVPGGMGYLGDLKSVARKEICACVAGSVNMSTLRKIDRAKNHGGGFNFFGIFGKKDVEEIGNDFDRLLTEIKMDAEKRFPECKRMYIKDLEGRLATSRLKDEERAVMASAMADMCDAVYKSSLLDFGSDNSRKRKICKCAALDVNKGDRNLGYATRMLKAIATIDEITQKAKRSDDKWVKMRGNAIRAKAKQISDEMVLTNEKACTEGK